MVTLEIEKKLQVRDYKGRNNKLDDYFVVSRKREETK